jgi:putative nucleotidyltransferase with HDIG domain
MLLLRTNRGAAGLRLITRTRLLEHLVPELEAGRGFEQPKEHTWDVLEHQLHTVAVIDDLFARDAAGRSTRRDAFWSQPRADTVRAHFADPGRLALLRLACLLHDAGKPATRQVRGGRVRFFGHPEVGAELAGQALRRLRFPNREVRYVTTLVAEHMRPGQLATPGQAPTRRALYRFFRDLGDLALDLLVLQFADAEATLGPRSTDASRRRHAAFISAMLDARAALMADAPPAVRVVTGDDMMDALGLEPGPQLGRILRAVEDAVGAGDVRTRDEAIEYGRRLLATPDPS